MCRGAGPLGLIVGQRWKTDNDVDAARQLVLSHLRLVVAVSRNYLGSINHSLLTAEVCRNHRITVAGWIFNDQYLHYEQEIVSWSGIPRIGSVPFGNSPDAEFVRTQAELIGPALREVLGINQ